MILGFKTKFPWGEPTSFREKILYNFVDYPNPLLQPKLHTIREGFRIKPGDTLHMATGVRTKFYNQFNKGIPGLEKCISVQSVRIFSDVKEVWIETSKKKIYKKLLLSEIKTLALNDGFDSVEQFWKWFDRDCIGQIIHWTNLVYK